MRFLTNFGWDKNLQQLIWNTSHSQMLFKHYHLQSKWQRNYTYIYSPSKTTNKKKIKSKQSLKQHHQPVVVPLLSITKPSLFSKHHPIPSHLLTSGSKAPHGRTRGAKHASGFRVPSGGNFRGEFGTVSPRNF